MNVRLLHRPVDLDFVAGEGDWDVLAGEAGDE